MPGDAGYSHADIMLKLGELKGTVDAIQGGIRDNAQTAIRVDQKFDTAISQLISGQAEHDKRITSLEDSRASARSMFRRGLVILGAAITSVLIPLGLWYASGDK